MHPARVGLGRSPVVPLEVVSWNSDGFFSALRTAGGRKHDRYGTGTDLFRRYPLVLLQEAHGGEADLLALRTAFPSHRFFGSFCSTPGAGGLLFSISPSITYSITFLEVVPGRIAFVRFSDAGRHYIIVNIHLCPGLGRALARSQLSLLRAKLREFVNDFILIVGDFNFVDPAEGRLQLPAGSLSLHHDLYYEV